MQNAIDVAWKLGVSAPVPRRERDLRGTRVECHDLSSRRVQIAGYPLYLLPHRLGRWVENLGRSILLRDAALSLVRLSEARTVHLDSTG